MEDLTDDHDGIEKIQMMKIENWNRLLDQRISVSFVLKQKKKVYLLN